MAEESKPFVYNQQIAIKTKEGLEYIKFVGIQELGKWIIPIW